jgi:hypothetical protein
MFALAAIFFQLSFSSIECLLPGTAEIGPGGNRQAGL